MPATKPSDVSDDVGLFDRLAEWWSKLTSRAPFAAFCVLFVALWLAEGIVRVASGGFSAFLDDKYQLQINTSTTIITFLLLAIERNATTRADMATQHKLNAIADGLADYFELCADSTSAPDRARRSVEELRRAVGLEDVESTD